MPGDGRTFARSTALGVAFCLAVLTDRVAGTSAPSVRDKYLSNLEARSQTELNSVVNSLRVTVNQLVTALHAIVLNLLKKVNCHHMPATLHCQVHNAPTLVASAVSLHRLVASIHGSQSSNILAYYFKICLQVIK